MSIRCNKELASQISSSSEIPRIFSKLYQDPTQRNFHNLYSSSISILDKFLWGKLFPTSSSFHPYFIWNFWSQLGLPFWQISLNFSKLIQINAKPYCASGRPVSVSSRAGPHASTHLHPAGPTCQRHRRPALCRGPPVRRLSSLCFPPATRARRTSLASTMLGPLPGAVRRSRLGPMAPPRRVAPPCPDPHLFPPLSPSTALSSSHSLPAHAAPLVLPSPLLSDSSSRAPEPPHRSPHPDRRLRPPAAHSPLWIPAEHRHRPPLPSELLPELPITTISCNFSHPFASPVLQDPTLVVAA
jgi:hypothetical protein